MPKTPAPTILALRRVERRKGAGGAEFVDGLDARVLGWLLDDADELRGQRVSYADLLDALALALPYVEEAVKDPAYKSGVVGKLAKRIERLVEAADGKSQDRARLAALEQTLKFDPDPEARAEARREYLALTEPQDA